MATVTEIAPDVYRISIFAPRFDLQFNHFVIRDEQPTLYHTGTRACSRLSGRRWQSSSTPRQSAGSVSVTSKWTSAVP